MKAVRKNNNPEDEKKQPIKPSLPLPDVAQIIHDALVELAGKTPTAVVAEIELKKNS